jgi:hypothetical protein
MKVMNDIDFLPTPLKTKSLSDREIVLQNDAAVEAIDVLEQGKWAIVSWEVWIRYPEGRIGH